MVTIKEITDKDLKSKITADVMGSLPEWFNPPESVAEKAVIHRGFPFFAAYENDVCIGFAALKIHNKFTADIYNIGVLREYHRHGAGHMLIAECEKYCTEKGMKFLTVKTLDESAEYEPYNGTRAFYAREGFIPLEVFTTFWDEDNPCLFLAKYLGE